MNDQVASVTLLARDYQHLFFQQKNVFELVTHFPEGEERKSRGGKVSILLGGHRPLGTLITFDERKIKRGNSGHGRHGRLFAKKSPRQNAVGFKMMLLNWLINAIAVCVCRLLVGGPAGCSHRVCLRINCAHQLFLRAKFSTNVR